jgi:DNA-binding MarR family transcriptional regulator
VNATTHRKSPTAADLKVWRDFVETGDHLRSLLAARLLAESALSTGDYAVLLALSEVPSRRLRSSDLADTVNWQRSRLSHHLARMEARGLVSREKCLTDSRGAEVVLTEQGATQFRRASAPHLKAVQELFIDALDPDLLVAIDRVTRALGKHLATTVRRRAAAQGSPTPD